MTADYPFILSAHRVRVQFTHLVIIGAVEVVVLVVGGWPPEGAGSAGVEEEQVEGEAAGEHGGTRSRGQDCDGNSSAAESLLSERPTPRLLMVQRAKER